MAYKDRAKQIAYQIAWAKRRRDKWFAENGPCVDCGTWEDLELDHVDARQKISHKIWGWSEARRIAELAKCVVRCFNCHRKKTVIYGEHAHGERHGNAKLTESQVVEIRTRCAEENASYAELAREFNVHRHTIERIVHGIRWNYSPP